MANWNTGPMWLVYRTASGIEMQPWQDLVEVGTLIDPNTGDDLEMVGWTTDPDSYKKWLE